VDAKKIEPEKMNEKDRGKGKKKEGNWRFFGTNTEPPKGDKEKK